MRIDAHQHFWNYNPVVYDWISNDMQMIRRDFLPGELSGVLQQNKFDGCVAVQSEQTESHNSFLLNLAEDHDFIKGVVGWINLRDEGIEEKLDYLDIFPKLKGFRHILQGTGGVMLEDTFVKGIKAIGKRGYTYDILVYPDQLPYVISLLKQCPEQKFVLDHLGKPAIEKGHLSNWKKDIEQLASYPNLYCKVSGLVTEAGWNNWKKADLFPCIETAVDAFGVDRLLFGSDWPVCLVAAEYEKVVEVAEDYFSSFSETARQKVFGLNAIEFYNLK